MDKDKLIQRLLVTFTGELEEHVRTLESAFLELEKTAEPDARERIFKNLLRTAHSLKGAARSVNLGMIETACHCLEEYLARVRDGRETVSRSGFALLFELADALRDVSVRLKAGLDIEGSSLPPVLPKLAAAAQGVAPVMMGEPAPEVRSQPVPPPLPQKPASSAAAEPTPVPASPPPAASLSDTVLRLSAEKLDALQTQGDELLMARQKARVRLGEIDQLQEIVRQWRAEWRQFERELASLTINEAMPNAAEGVALGPAARPAAPQVAQRLAKGRERLRQLERGLQQVSASLAGDGRAIEGAVRQLNAEIHRVRMQPFAWACEGMDRMVRDLAAARNKSVELVVAGGAIEIDRSILVGLKDPLRHLVRNAIDHGIERPEDRVAAGKSRSGTIRVEASLQGDRIEVVVADDGRGLDVAAIRQQSLHRGLPADGEEAEVLRRIFLPGFSTASTVTKVSGRGVGLDVVKSTVEAMRGTVSVSHRAGGSTEFRLALPLTLTTIRALVVRARGQTFAFDTANIDRLLRIRPDDIKHAEGRPIIILQGEPLPLLDLAEWLVLPAREVEYRQEYVFGVVLRSGERSAVILVDELLAEQDSVVRSLGPRLSRLKAYVGGTLLPSGQTALILNASTLLDSALRHKAGKGGVTAKASAAGQRKRLLVVDDSVTTRTLEKSILEGAGYEVETAADGAEAWQILQDRGADLIVSDVEMPRMDGFALTEAIRSSKRLKNLPVVLVTAKETEEDRERGLTAGADAYLMKSAFDQSRLLDIIAQIL